MVTVFNESKTLIKHISFKFKCKFDGKNVIPKKKEIMKSVDVNVKAR